MAQTKGLAMPPTRRDFPKKKQKHADTGPKLLSAIKKTMSQPTLNWHSPCWSCKRDRSPSNRGEDGIG